MGIALTGAFLLFVLLGLLLVPFGLPGTFIIVLAATIYGYATGFAEITGPVIALLLAAALFAEGAELLSGIVGARRYGSGSAGVAASLAGGVAGALAGAPVLFGLGAVPGALLGAFGGAVAAEAMGGKPLREALRAGWGTFLGRVAGTAVKAAVAVAMAALCLRQLFA